LEEIELQRIVTVDTARTEVKVAGDNYANIYMPSQNRSLGKKSLAAGAAGNGGVMRLGERNTS
jgi:hypothetical protein